MPPKMRTAIVLLGGLGLRFGQKTPKQMTIVSGREVFLHALERLVHLDNLILVVHRDYMPQVSQIVRQSFPSVFPRVRFVVGGDTRQASVWAALSVLNPATESVLIHDGVRPYFSRDLLSDGFLLAESVGAAIPVCPIAGTVVRHTPQALSYLDHRELFEVQTPQFFAKDLILRAHRQAQSEGKGDYSDDSQMLQSLGVQPELLEGSILNIKLTYPHDLDLLEHLMGDGL